MTDARRGGISVPAHIGVLVGLSTSAYALTLAGITGLQSSTEGAARAARAPMVAAIGEMTTAHDGLQARLDRARVAYEAAAGAYSDAGLAVDGLEARITALVAAVTEVNGSASSLPSAVRLPAVRLPAVTRSVTAAAAPPPVQATTGASGG
jgi:hypothetical protein